MPDIRICPDPATLGRTVAERVDAILAAKSGEQVLLGCPGGRSPVPVYEALAGLVAKRGRDLSKLIIVMMDDYLRRAGDGFDHVPADAHYSCRRFARQDIQAVLNRDLPETRRIADANVWFPSPAEPSAYEARIGAAGGIDFFILASGAGDGHVAFNPPGSPRDSRTRIVELPEQTKRDNLRTFPEFRGIEDVPTHGITVGIDTIAQWSSDGAMVVWGTDKKVAFQKLTRGDGYRPDWPATVWTQIGGATLYADEAAAGAAS